MIARVGITVDALDEVSSDPHLPVAVLVAQHRDITAALLKHGALVFSDATEAEEMRNWLDTLGQLSPTAHQHWKAALKALSRNRRMLKLDPAVGALRSAVERKALEAWRGQLEVAIVDSDQLQALGVAPPQLSFHDDPSGLDVTCASVTSHCSAFRRLEDLAADGTWAYGERRDDFFAQVLAAPARESYRIGIADRFLYRDLYKEGASSAFVWLLERLGQLPASHFREAVVMSEVVFDGDPGRDGTPRCPRNVDEASAALAECWRGRARGGLSKVTLVAACQARDDRVPHDRHISFDAGVAVNFPAGFDRFSTSSIEVPEGITWTYLSSPKAMQKVFIAENRFRYGPRSEEAVVFQQTRVAEAGQEVAQGNLGAAA